MATDQGAHVDAMGQSVAVNGLRMYVAIAGEGPPVLLLHGFPDTHTVWRKQVGALVGAGFRVIAPDLRGYGKTDAPGPVAAYAIEQLRGDVVALLDALGVDKVRLVGHDWGAVVGWQVCMHAPQRVERFVALSVGHPQAFARAGLGQRLRSFYMAVFQLRGVAERLLRAGDWFVLRRFTSDPTQPGYWRRELALPGRLTAALNYYRANLKLGLPRQYPPVTVPVLGIWSSGDVALTEAQMKDSARHVAGPFRYERIEGADHWLQLTAADRVNALLLEFFSSQR
jgi:pimeloyl-ACP methyl ester carboxylesterase